MTQFEDSEKDKRAQAEMLRKANRSLEIMFATVVRRAAWHDAGIIKPSMMMRGIEFDPPKGSSRH